MSWKPVEYHPFIFPEQEEGIYPIQRYEPEGSALKPRKILAFLGGCSSASMGGAQVISQRWINELEAFNYYPEVINMSTTMGLPRLTFPNAQSIPDLRNVVDQIPIEFRPNDQFFAYSNAVNALELASTNPYTTYRLILMDPVGCYPYPGDLAKSFAINPLLEVVSRFTSQSNPLTPKENNNTLFERVMENLNVINHMRAAWVTKTGIATPLQVFKELLFGSNEHIKIAQKYGRNYLGWSNEDIKKLESTKPNVEYLSKDRPELREEIFGNVTVCLYEHGISSFNHSSDLEIREAFPNARSVQVYRLQGSHITPVTNPNQVISVLARNGVFNN